MKSLDLARWVLDQCQAIGVDEFVFCGGARDAAFAVALDELGDAVQVWTHFDERSAGFFALGRCMAMARPVAVITTSGTAAAELLPACIEAHYQGRPLLLITADRPTSFRGSGAPQAIDQSSLFDGHLCGKCDVSQPQDLFTGWTAEGPYQLNVCLDEPLLGSDDEADGLFEGEQSSLSRPSRPNVASLAQFLRDDTWRGLVLMIGGLEPEEREAVLLFAQDLAVPVIADATSGIRELLGDQLLVDGDRLLLDPIPGKILRLGEVPVGRFWRDLESLPQINVFSVTPSGYSGLARPSQVIKGSVGSILQSLGPVEAIDDPADFFAHHLTHATRIDELLEAFPDSEPGLIRTLSIYATLTDLVYLGNSLPIREWNLAAQRQEAYAWVRANRGANGIDGQISTFLGLSADGGEAWAVLGELTALYDCNALAMLPQLAPGKRILAVINNGGGRIFDQLPGLKNSGERPLQWMRQTQDFDLEGLAKLWKISYRCILKTEDLDQEFDDGCTLLEIRPSSSETERFWQAYASLRS